MSEASNVSSKPDVIERVYDEYRALRNISYTGDRPDLDERDVDLIAALIIDLGGEVVHLRAELEALRLKHDL